MKLIKVTPISDAPSLKSLLKQTEPPHRDSIKIKWPPGRGAKLFAEVGSLKPEREWKILQSFIGYLDRHLGEYIQSITITYQDGPKERSPAKAA
jgi:hypothetical protein